MNDRLTIEQEINCDYAKLFNNDLNVAISYLSEMHSKYSHLGTISLDECWTGYEEMHMRFVLTRLENDEEYNHRLKFEQEIAETKKLKQRQQIEEKKQKALLAFNKAKLELEKYN
jgi:hypothetical protein